MSSKQVTLGAVEFTLFEKNHTIKSWKDIPNISFVAVRKGDIEQVRMRAEWVGNQKRESGNSIAFHRDRIIELIGMHGYSFDVPQLMKPEVFKHFCASVESAYKDAEEYQELRIGSLFARGGTKFLTSSPDIGVKLNLYNGVTDIKEAPNTLIGRWIGRPKLDIADYLLKRGEEKPSDIYGSCSLSIYHANLTKSEIVTEHIERSLSICLSRQWELKYDFQFWLLPPNCKFGCDSPAIQADPSLKTPVS